MDYMDYQLMTDVYDLINSQKDWGEKRNLLSDNLPKNHLREL
jgi:uncharacterized protein (DUF608 family)